MASNDAAAMHSRSVLTHDAPSVNQSNDLCWRVTPGASNVKQPNNLCWSEMQGASTAHPFVKPQTLPVFTPPTPRQVKVKLLTRTAGVGGADHVTQLHLRGRKEGGREGRKEGDDREEATVVL